MRRNLLLLLSSIALAACASSPASKETGKAVTGTAVYTSKDAKTMPVGAIPSAMLHDARRNKDLEVSIEYPTQGGPYPVIIFSPGYGATNLSYVGLSSYWTSRGYVVMKPRHADAGALREYMREHPAPAPDEGRGRRGRQRAETPAQPAQFRPDPAEMWDKQTPADWQNRVDDIRLLIDSMATLVEQYPELKPRLDATRIGVGGHSYGAFTAMLIGGMRTSATGAATSYADPRVKAIVAMSPQGPGGARGLTGESWAGVKLPVLFMTGSRDFGVTETEDPAWRRLAFQDSPAGDKWFVNIQGASHYAFTGGVVDPSALEITRPPDTSPVIPQRGPFGDPGTAVQQPVRTPDRRGGMFAEQNTFGTVRSISLAFWDTYLKNDASGRTFLQGLTNRGDVHMETK